MKIVKYSKQNGDKYKIILEDNQSVLLHEDVILNNDLLLKKEIDDIEELVKQNSKYEILELSLKYLNHKVRSIKEMTNYLLKKNYNEDEVNKTIDYLLQKGYLSDTIYARSYILDRLNLSNDGPIKIVKYLESENISNDIYEEYLKVFTNEVIEERINKYITKMIKSNKKSKYVLKSKIMLNLINLGYLKEDIERLLNNVDDIDDRSNYEETKKRLIVKLSKKYQGNDLERKLKEKLYQLGYFN